MGEKELIIRIAQYVDKSNPENSSVFLSIDCYFGEKEIFKDYKTLRLTFKDLCDLLSGNNRFNSNPCQFFRLRRGMATFNIPIRFEGIVIYENNPPPFLPQSSKTLRDEYCFIVDTSFPTPFFFKKVTFKGVFFTKIHFVYTIFRNSIVSTALWESGVEFKNCHFKRNVDFKNSVIGTTTMPTLSAFDHCTFHKKADFSNSTFGVKTYFHRSTFKDEALFYRSKFSDVANFYFTTFHKAPNFSMCVFNNSKLANFIGVDTSRFDMENIEKYVIEKAKSETEGKEGKINSLRGRGIEYLKIQHALNVRDSFRTIKETLNAQANVFESQKWHKLELYAKEIELGYRIGFKELEKKAQQFLNAKIDEEKNYAGSVRTYIPQQDDSRELLKINKREWLKNIIEYCQLWFYRHTSDHHMDLMRIISWVIIAIGAFGLTFFWVKCIYDSSTISKLNFYCIRLSLYGTILILNLYLAGWIRKFFIFAGSVGLISTLWIVYYKPSLIFGAVNLFDKNSKYSGVENIVLAIYTLIMILLLFSLQKTARKNSIIPN